MTDPRAKSKEKVPAPFPLPHVSRRALARVKDALPAPKQCPYCKGRVELVNNEQIYGREYGQWPYAYRCAGDCDAHVGLHPHTDIPLGTLANKELRDARKSAKFAFNEMMKALRLSRDEAYPLLAQKLDLNVEVCHFGWFDLHHCGEAKQACIELIKQEKGRSAA